MGGKSWNSANWHPYRTVVGSLLHKPVSPYDLLTKARSVLDGAG